MSMPETSERNTALTVEAPTLTLPSEIQTFESANLRQEADKGLVTHRNHRTLELPQLWPASDSHGQNLD